MKRIILSLVVAFTTICSFAQTTEYNVIAKAFRNMQTQQFGSAKPVDITITRNGNTSIAIDTTLYKVVTVDENIKTDSMTSVQFTVVNGKGEEYIIKMMEDPWAKASLMKNFVIIFSTASPFDWMYYFCNKPEEAI